MNAIKHLGILSFCLVTACNSVQRSSDEPLVQTNNIAKRDLSTNQNSSLKAAPLKAVPLERQAMSGGQQRTPASSIASWKINGALAAKSKSKGWSAALNWAQQGSGSYQIRLMGPLGSGSVIINKQGSNVVFQDGAKTATSTNADELLFRQTGIRLPVNNLHYWVRGIPAPGGVQAEQRDQLHHLLRLQQNGYTINFSNYTSVRGVDLPSMIRLEGNGVMIKLAIRNWSI